MAWMLCALSQVNFRLNFFAVVNLSIFSTVTFLIRKIKDRRLNLWAAVLSILTYSVSIDVVCYYFYPQYVWDHGLLSYVWSGVSFNCKYVFCNGLVALFLLETGERVLQCPSWLNPNPVGRRRGRTLIQNCTSVAGRS
ncbi:MAG: hypothetical protein LBJ70_04470 [Holosporales bacterium]|nr:hypothetical protein [Holosporales bacterium]